jgi:hypothetical protein
MTLKLLAVFLDPYRVSCWRRGRKIPDGRDGGRVCFKAAGGNGLRA